MGIGKLFDLADDALDNLTRALPDDYERETDDDRDKHVIDDPIVKPSDLSWSPVNRDSIDSDLPVGLWHCFIENTPSTLCNQTFRTNLIGPRFDRFEMRSDKGIAACLGCIQSIHSMMLDLYRNSR